MDDKLVASESTPINPNNVASSCNEIRYNAEIILDVTHTPVGVAVLDKVLVSSVYAEKYRRTGWLPQLLCERNV